MIMVHWPQPVWHFSAFVCPSKRRIWCENINKCWRASLRREPGWPDIWLVNIMTLETDRCYCGAIVTSTLSCHNHHAKCNVLSTPSGTESGTDAYIFLVVAVHEGFCFLDLYTIPDQWTKHVIGHFWHSFNAQLSLLAHVLCWSL